MEGLIKIGIVEDSLMDQDILSSFVKEFFFEKDINIQLSIFNKGEDLLLSEETFDLLFLDMYLPDMIGVDLLHRVRSKGVNAPVIFSTASKEFVEQSYEAEALHYIVKPVTAEKIEKALTKFLHLNQSLQTISLRVGRDRENFPIQNIVFIESFSHKCILHTIKDEVEISETIGDITEKFEKYYFVKVNRTTLINMRYINAVTSTDVVLMSGEYFSISRNNKSEIKQIISDFRNKN